MMAAHTELTTIYAHGHDQDSLCLLRCAKAHLIGAISGCDYPVQEDLGGMLSVLP